MSASSDDRRWAKELRRAERQLRRNADAIERTARGTASRKPSDYRLGASVSSTKPVRR